MKVADVRPIFSIEIVLNANEIEFASLGIYFEIRKKFNMFFFGWMFLCTHTVVLYVKRVLLSDWLLFE